MLSKINLRKTTLMLVLGIVIFSSFASKITFSQESSNENTYPEIPVAYFEAYEDITEVKTEIILDQANRLHIFVMYLFENETFIIKHIVGGKKIFIYQEQVPGLIFNAFETSEGIVLFYTHYGQFGQFHLHMYKWNEKGYSNGEVYAPNIIFSGTLVYNFQEGYENGQEMFHLLLAEPLAESAMDEYPETRIRHIRIYLDRSYELKTHITSLLYNEIQSTHYINGTLYALFKYMTYPTRFLNLYRVNETKHNLVAQLTFTTDYNVHLSIFNDESFNLVLTRGGKIYTLNFGINETISFDEFTVGNLGIYAYKNFQSFSFNDKIIYLIDPIPYIDYNNKNAAGEINTETIALGFNGSTLNKMDLSIPSTKNASKYESCQVRFVQENKYIASRTQLEDVNKIQKQRIIEDNIFSVKVLSNIEMQPINQIVINDLTLMSGFEYLWEYNWYYVVGPIAFVGLIVLIFFRKTKILFQKMTKFLFRPIGKEASKLHRFIVNIGVFIRNIISIPFDLWKSNKKRALISILGLSILSLIILSSTTLFASKQNMMVSEYLENANIKDDEKLSASFSRTHNVLRAGWGRVNEYAPIFKNFSHAVINEMLSTIATQTQVLKDVIDSVDYSTHMRILFGKALDDPVMGVESYYGLSKSYSPFLSELLVEGKLPSDKNEIIIDSTTAEGFQKEINDTLVLYGVDYSVSITERTTVKIVGIYEQPSKKDINFLCTKYSLSSDLAIKIAQYIGGITFNEYYLENLADVPAMHLGLEGKVQFFYNYSLINTENFRQLIIDFNTLRPGFEHSVKFDLGGSWSIGTEMKSLLLDLAPDYASTQFLIILLSIPVIYLAIFIIFETNALFSTSFEKEIEILRSKGLSTSKIVFINMFMKIIEAFFATFIGLLGALVLIKPLLKIDSFLSFKQPVGELILSNIPITMIITYLTLVFITLPLTIKMSKQKKKKTRPAERFVTFLKKIKVLNFIIMAIGGGIMYGGITLYKTFSENLVTANNSLILIFTYLIGMGAMIVLFGLGLLLRDLHSVLMIGLSKMIWKAKKSIFSFSLVEVRSDISLFNDVFLTYLLLIGIAVPSIVTPLTIQESITSDSLFLAGGEMYVKNWGDANDTIRTQLEQMDGIISVSNISQASVMYLGRQMYILVLDDPNKYLETAYKPRKRFFQNWEEIIPQLAKENTMIASSPFVNSYNVSKENTHDFLNNGIELTYEIVSAFDYFPIIYPYGPRESSSGGTPVLVLSQDNYAKIEETFTLFGVYGERLLINIDEENYDAELIASQIENELGFEVVSAEEREKNMFNDAIPFYPSLVSTFVFALLVCMISIVFTSMSNPLKILKRRIGKHDILKKMGVPNTQIIKMSSFELFTIGILPGIVIGGGLGFAITKIIVYVFKDLRSGTLPTVMQLPPLALVVIFAIIPLMFYVIFYVTMKAQFAAYQPINLE